jgi:hypothetical protein
MMEDESRCPSLRDKPATGNLELTYKILKVVGRVAGYFSMAS